MKTFRRSILAAGFCSAVLGMAAIAAGQNYRVLPIPAPGLWPVSSGVGKIAHLRLDGAYPTNSTVVLSLVSADNTATNALLTRTDANGSINAAIGTGTNLWLVAGDQLLRGGTITNASPLQIILEQ